MALGDERRPERRVEGCWSSPAGQFTWRTGTEVLDFGTQLTIFMVYEGIWGMSLSCNSSHHDGELPVESPSRAASRRPPVGNFEPDELGSYLQTSEARPQ